MSGNNLEFGIKLRYDGKDVDAGISINRETLQKFAAETKRAGATASESFNSAAASASSFGGVLKGVLAGVSVGALVYEFKAVSFALIDAQQAAQKLRNSLEYSAGGAAAAASEIAYLRDVTRQLGLDFATASVAYSKFAAATRDSGISAAQTKTIFEGVAAASARMGLSADETQGALLALSQMASKGTVQAEELRGQLGERLPGAFNIAAKAMGVTTAELGKMLEQGQVLASDFLPKFGEALKTQFQAPLNSLTQEVNRLTSAWALWKTELSEGTDGGGFKWLTNGLNESAASMRALGKEAGIVQKLLIAIGGFEAGVIGAGSFDTQALQAQAMEKLYKAKQRLAALEEKQASSKLTSVEAQQLEHYTASVKAAREELLRLAEVRGKETGIKLPDLKGEFEAQKAKQAAQANAYLNDTTHGSKASKIAAEIEAENKAYKAAIAGFSETDDRYVKMLSEHNTRVAEIKAKAKTGTVGTKNDAAQEFAARIAEEKDFTETQITLIKQRVAQGLLSEEQGAADTLDLQKQHFAAQTKLLTEQLGKTKDVGDRAKLGQELKAVANDAEKAQSAYASALAKMAQERDKYQRNVLTSIDNSTYKTEQENEALRAQIDVLGLTDKQLGEYEAAKTRAAAAAEYLDAANLREAASSMEAAGVAADAVQYYRQLADAREAAGKALDQKSLLESEKGMKKAAVDAAAEWKKTSEKIGDNITDALMRGFESGKTVAENLRDAIVNMFSTMVLRPVVQATVTGGVSALGLTSDGSVSTSSASGLGSFGTLASGAKSAYEIFSGGAANTYNNMASSSLGQSLGLSTAQSAGYMAPVYDATGALISEGTGTAAGGLTSLGSSIGTGLAYAGAGLIGSAIGSAIAGDKRIISGVSSSTIGAAVGALAGPLGAGIGGIVGGLFDAAFGSGEVEYTDAGMRGTFSGTSFSGEKYQNWEQEGGWFSGDDDGTDTSPIDSATTSALSNSFTLLKLETGRLAAGLGVDTANIAAYSKAINVTLTDDASANATAITNMIAGISEEMSAMVLFGTNLNLAGETNSETLSRLYNSLTTVNSAFKSINISAYATSLAGGDMASQLALAMGGIDAFKTSITSYYDTYFSAAEKQADLTAQVTASFAAMGVAMPSTKEGLRAIVESLDMTTASGRATFAGLMSVESAFAQMTDTAAATVKALADARATLISKFSATTTTDQATASIKSSGLIDITGMDADAIRSAMRTVIATATQSTLDTITGLLPAFEQVIQGITDAAEAAAAKEAAILSERQGLQDQLDALTMTSAQSREKELSALDASNQALQERIYALTDEAAIAEERSSLEKELLTAQGNTVALRELERQALDKSNRAIYDQIRALEDQKAAAAAAIEKVNELFTSAQNAVSGALSAVQRAVAAEKTTFDAAITAERTRLTASRDVAQESVSEINAAINTVLDTLRSNIADLYASVDSASAQSVASGNAFIDSALSAVRKSGYLPDADALSSAISAARGGLDANNYASQFEYERATLTLAGKLSQLKGVGGSQLTVAEQALSAANAQLDALDAAAKDGAERFEATLSAAQAQVDAINMVNTSVLSISVAMSSLSAAISQQQAAGAQQKLLAPATDQQIVADYQASLEREPDASGFAYWHGQAAAGKTASEIAAAIEGSPEARIVDMYWSLLGRAPDAEGQAFWQKQADSGSMSLSDISAWFVNSPEYKSKRPSYAVGTNYVPKDMLAQIHEGEEITPKAWNPAIAGRGQNNSARLERLVESLTAEVQRLQGLVATGNQHATRTANAVNGNPEQPMLVETV